MVIELLFLSLTVEALQGKMCQNSLPSLASGSVSAKISGGSGRPPANILIALERQLVDGSLESPCRVIVKRN